MLKKFSSDKADGTKNALFFLSRAPTHHCFTFNFDSYMSRNTRFVSLKLCVWDFAFSITFRFLLKFIFLFNKMHGLFGFKTL